MADVRTWIRQNPGKTALGAGALATGVFFLTPLGKRALTKLGLRGTPKKSSGTTTPAVGGGSTPTKPAAERGFIICPEEVQMLPPTDLALLEPGDFVTLAIADATGKLAESLWGQVSSMTPDKQDMNVMIVGQWTDAGLKLPATDKHGFRYGDKIFIDRRCVFDILHHEGGVSEDAKILCDASALSVIEDGEYEQLSQAEVDQVTNHHMVWFVVASKTAQGTAWHELIPAHVMEISPYRAIVKVMVANDPELTANHGLRRFSKVSITRSCIVHAEDTRLTLDPFNSIP